MNDPDLSPGEMRQSTTLEGPSRERFAFHGSGSEYFRIWTVNVLFSIVTLGIYSAWAKVRTKRYFYGNTELAGDRFEYLANPIAILKGRLIGVALLIAYTVAGLISTTLGGLAGLALALSLPLIFIQAFRFNAHNSAWRGVRFGFDGGAWPAYKAYLLWPLFGLVTLGLGMPLALHRINQYQFDNHRFGESLGNSTARAGGFYRIALISVGIFIGLFVVTFVVFVLITGLLVAEQLSSTVGAEDIDPENLDADLASRFLLAGLVGYFGFLLSIFTAGFAYEAMRFGMVFNRIDLAENHIRNEIRAPRYFWIQFSNLLLILVTLGLYTPWARVRRARYLLPAMWLETQDLDNFVTAEADRISAGGDEIGEAFDLGIGV